MKNFQVEMFVTLWSLLLAGCVLADSNSSYDYSASIDCLEEPLPPQYGGGLVSDPGFDLGLGDWLVSGSAKIMIRNSSTGNNYLVVYNRSRNLDEFSNMFDVQKDLLYMFSAWFQLSEGEDIVSTHIKHPDGHYTIIGSTIVKAGCWSMLKGGFTADETMNGRLVFELNNTQGKTELWIENVSLQQFTKVEWREQQQKSIETVRKRQIRIHVRDKDGNKIQGANISISQTRPLFPIGSGTPQSILDYKGYQDFFTKRFTAVTFHNEMKWYFTETTQGHENYTVPDAMVAFFKENNIQIRGHNILWDAANSVPYWATLLPPDELQRAANRRVESVVSRYGDDVIAWDVMNENLHNTYFEDRLGANASAMLYQMVGEMDPDTALFLNEYNTLEYENDLKVTPRQYVEKFREIRSFPGNENMTISFGIQGHFLLTPNVSYIRAAFDVIGATNMPIWLTELDFKRGPDQAAQLEDVMREAFSHPSVEGIIVWGGWKPSGCNETCLNITDGYLLPKTCIQMCLIDDTFKIQPPGEVVDKLINEWKTANVSGVTDLDGVFEQTVFHGDYSLTYSHPSEPTPVEMTFNVTKEPGPLDIWVDLYTCSRN